MTKREREQVVELPFADERLPPRFWAKVARRGDCWIWVGALGPRPVLWMDDKNRGAAHLAFVVAGGLIPNGHCLTRLCGEGICVNPAHARIESKSALRSRTNRDPSLRERLEAKLGRPNERGCIEFLGARNQDGYGVLHSRRRREIKAHRAAWELKNGPISAGMVVMHRCDNPPCCNIEHLQLGTVADNNRDRHAKGRTRGLVPGGKPARVEDGSWP